MITADTVFSDEVTIDAPVEAVWSVLTDFDNYRAWNPFNPQINTRLELGADVIMQVDLGNGLQEQIETMEKIQENEVLAWSMTLNDRATLHACRTQTLKKIDDDRCTYLSTDRFEGSLKDDILAAHGPAIEQGFNACAYALRDYVQTLIAN